MKIHLKSEKSTSTLWQKIVVQTQNWERIEIFCVILTQVDRKLTDVAIGNLYGGVS